MDGPELLCVSCLSASSHRKQVQEIHGAGSRRGRTRAPHIPEGIFPLTMLHRPDKGNLRWRGRLHISISVNERQRAEGGDGHPTGVRRGYARGIPSSLGTPAGLGTPTGPPAPDLKNRTVSKAKDNPHCLSVSTRQISIELYALKGK